MTNTPEQDLERAIGKLLRQANRDFDEAARRILNPDAPPPQPVTIGMAFGQIAAALNNGVRRFFQDVSIGMEQHRQTDYVLAHSRTITTTHKDQP